jgi:hypothetical protein
MVSDRAAHSNQRDAMHDLYEYFRSELSRWSPAQFAFDAGLTVVITTIVGAVTDMSWLELIVVGISLLVTTTAAMVLWNNRVATVADHEAFLRRATVVETMRRMDAVTGALRWIGHYTQIIPRDTEHPEYEKQYREWRSMTVNHFRGLFSDELSKRFDEVSQPPVEPAAVMAYLSGISSSLSPADIRGAITNT